MKLLACSALVFACLGVTPAQTVLDWHTDQNGHIELRENGRVALVYNQGPQLKEGAPEDRRRCCYLYPVYTPAGVSVLDDFPKDHWHHRGLFWAWPVVETGGKKYDGWMMHGLNVRADRSSSKSGTKAATLSAENSWYAGAERIVAEKLEVTAYPAANNAREFDVAVELKALKAPVTLRGSQEQGKSYGGFSARFAPRENTVLRADGQRITKDEDLNPHRWAELEAVYGGKRASLRITPDPADPGAPYQWCLRNYGFVGASFPGRTPDVQEYTLQPGKPLLLKFRVRVADLP